MRRLPFPPGCFPKVFISVYPFLPLGIRSPVPRFGDDAFGDVDFGDGDDIFGRLKVVFAATLAGSSTGVMRAVREFVLFTVVGVS